MNTPLHRQKDHVQVERSENYLIFVSMVRDNSARFIFLTILFVFISYRVLPNSEFIYGITIDNYPHIYEKRPPVSHLDSIVVEMNRLHLENRYLEVLSLLKESIVKEKEANTLYKLKYLYLFKLNQYGKWVQELTEVLDLSSQIPRIRNDTIRLYLSYYMLKFNLKLLDFPWPEGQGEREAKSMAAGFEDLVQDAHIFGLFELEIQLRRLMATKGILLTPLEEALTWECYTELDSFRIGRQGFLDWDYTIPTDTTEWLKTGFYLMRATPSWDFLQRFQYAINLLRVAIIFGDEDACQVSKKQCLASMQHLNDLEVYNHYYSTLVELSPYLPVDSAFSNMSSLMAIGSELDKLRTSAIYKAQLTSDLLNNLYTIKRQKKMIVLGAILLALALMFVALLYLVLWKRKKTLNERSKLLKGLIASVSHDIRMPLQQSISSLSKQKGKPNPSITLELRKIISFIDEITISLKTGHITDHQNLMDLIDETSDLYRNAILRKKLILSVRIPERVGKQTLPGPLYRIVIRNLFLNAIEHNPPNGYINITAEEVNNEIGLVIENSKRKESEGGSQKGLGLDLINNILKEHPSFIDLTSVTEGENIQFQLTWRPEINLPV